jgi:hypothetical protein
MQRDTWGMIATGHADAGGPDQGATPRLWSSFAMALRLLGGWLCVAIGVLNLLVELDRSGREAGAAYLTFHFVLLVGGVVLLALPVIEPRPGRVGYLSGAAAALAGLIGSAVPATQSICCVRTFAVRHGFPFTFLARHGAGDRWHVDGRHTLADLLFWAYVGLFALVAASLLRRGPDLDDADEERQYIEHRPERYERSPQGARERGANEAPRHQSGPPGDAAHGAPERDPRGPDDRTVGPLP